MICNNCGADLPEGSEFCICCGSPVTAPVAAPVEEPTVPKVCFNCGAPLTDDSAFCTVCGTPVTAAPEVPVVEKPAKKKAPKEPGKSFLDRLPIPKKVAIFGGAGVLAVLLAVIILCVALSGGGAEGVAVDYVEARMECNVDALLELFHEDVLDEYFSSSAEERLALGYWEDNMDDCLNDYDDEYGKDRDYNVEVIYVNETPEDELRDTNKSYKKTYGVEVEDEAQVILLLEHEGEEYNEASTMSVRVVKIDGDWYLTPGAVFNVF